MWETVVSLLVLAAIPAVIASSKGYSGLGFYLYGLLLLPVAIVHAIVLQRRPPDAVGTVTLSTGETYRPPGETAAPPHPDRKPCPDCGESIAWSARVCRFCGYRLAPPPGQEVTAPTDPPPEPVDKISPRT